MPDYCSKKDRSIILPFIHYWKRSWIIMVDNSLSMGICSIAPGGLTKNVKKAIGTMLEEIKEISEEQEILSYIRIIIFGDSISYAVGNRYHGKYITEAIDGWKNFELIPNGGANVADAVYEAGRAVLADAHSHDWLSPVLMIMTDGMGNLANRAGDSIDYIKSIRNGHTIRISIGLVHDYRIELDPFASRGFIEHYDGKIDAESPFSFFVEQVDNLPNVCKYLSWGLTRAAIYNESSLIAPMEDWDIEDDDWEWE